MKTINYLFTIAILIVSSFIVYTEAKAGPFVGGGVGWTPYATDERCTEICFRDDLLAMIKVGWRWRITDNGITHQIEASHYSAPVVEDFGLNIPFMWTIEKEWTL